MGLQWVKHAFIFDSQRYCVVVQALNVHVHCIACTCTCLHGGMCNVLSDEYTCTCMCAWRGFNVHWACGNVMNMCMWLLDWECIIVMYIYVHWTLFVCLNEASVCVCLNVPSVGFPVVVRCLLGLCGCLWEAIETGSEGKTRERDNSCDCRLLSTGVGHTSVSP